jgi:hypothetical protein
VLCAAFRGLCVKQKSSYFHIQSCAKGILQNYNGLSAGVLWTFGTIPAFSSVKVGQAFVPQGLHPLPSFTAADFTQSVQSE